jgi:enoyl-CoA hydratase
MAFENLLIEDKGRIRRITINRESKLNALNTATLAELHTALTEAFTDKTIGGLIITGTGSKAFVAGADISEFTGFNSEAASRRSREVHNNVCNLIEHASKPVIAAVNGFALGGGLELAMACHIRIASENAKMGLPEATLGLIPGYGGTQRLTRLVGRGKALEMIMTADMITATDALQAGLVNHVVSQEELLTKAEEMLTKILSRAPLALAAAIKAVNDASNPSANGFETEIAEFGKLFDTLDAKEGVAAFLEKRKAEFRGE